MISKSWIQRLVLVVGIISATALFVSAQELTQTKKVGPVTLILELEPEEPRIGDELTLTLEVAAEPDVEVLMPEFGEALDAYAIADFVPKEEMQADGSMLFRQKYTLLTRRSGEQSIAPLLVEFIDNRPGQKAAPVGYDAFEILTERIDFVVQSIAPSGAAAELRPPLGELKPPASAESLFAWLWLVIPVLLVCFAAFAWWWYRRREVVIRRNAYDIARGRVDRIVAKLGGSIPIEPEQFYVELSGVIRTYIENRVGLRAPDLTTDEFRALAQSEQSLTVEHQEILSEFLRKADMVKFASASASAEDMQKSSQVAIRFLEETRADAPEIVVTDGLDPGQSEGASNRSGSGAAAASSVNIASTE